MYNYFYTGRRRAVSMVNTTSGPGVDVPEVRVLEEHNITYVLEGTIEVERDDTTVTLNKDDVVIIHAGQRHTARACSETSRIFYMHIESFEEDSLTENETGADFNSGECIVLKDHFHCTNTQNLKHIFDKMISIRFLVDRGNFKMYGLSSYLDVLLYELKCIMDGSDHTSNNIINIALRIVAAHPARFYTLEEMAQNLQCSKKTLEKKFKEVSGYTFHQYQIHKKIEAVFLDLKSNPNTPLKSLASKYGFYDEFHLSKSFKKVLGVSPMEYRSVLKNLQHTNY